jgi:hypothetical protein
MEWLTLDDTCNTFLPNIGTTHPAAQRQIPEGLSQLHRYENLKSRILT